MRDVAFLDLAAASKRYEMALDSKSHEKKPRRGLSRGACREVQAIRPGCVVIQVPRCPSNKTQAHTAI